MKGCLACLLDAVPRRARLCNRFVVITVGTHRLTVENAVQIVRLDVSCAKVAYHKVESFDSSVGSFAPCMNF